MTHVPATIRHGRPAIIAAIALVLALGLTQTTYGLHVVASTAWTAAIAEAAGASPVTVLASFELRHPPERDFRPSDITAAVTADVLAWAGYEAFVNQLISAANIPDSTVYRISTENTPDHLVAETRRLATAWGTERAQAAWEESFLALTDTIKTAAVAAGTDRQRVVVSGHLSAFVAWLDYDIIDTFGFEDMTPARLHELTQLNPDIVIDVWHNPTAEAVAVAAQVPYVTLINFPGHSGTRSLSDVFAHNAAQLGLQLD